MEPITISLPDSLKKFIDGQVAAWGFDSREDYVIDLIERNQSSEVDDRAEMEEFLRESREDKLAGRVFPAREAIEALHPPS